MCNVELIIESNLSSEEEEMLKSIANIKYKIPLINSIVIKIEENNMEELKNLGF